MASFYCLLVTGFAVFVCQKRGDRRLHWVKGFFFAGDEQAARKAVSLACLSGESDRLKLNSGMCQGFLFWGAMRRRPARLYRLHVLLVSGQPDQPKLKMPAPPARTTHIF